MIQQTLGPRKLQFGLNSLLVMVALATVTAGIVHGQSLTSSSIAIENFGKVNDTYYRGGQPREKDVGQLKQLGVKTIIDLRKDKKPQEADWAARAGLSYFNIPLLPGRAATEEQANYFLSLVNDPANWPVYVHCKGGRHRTGALTAIYRITHDGWTATQAFDEMLRYDFENGWFGGPGAQKKFVFSFYDRHVSSHHKK